jgi:hypothetical protein
VLAVAPAAQPAVAQQQESSRVAAQQQQGSPLVIVDGRIVSNSRLDFDKLQVESIEVLKPDVARRKFGERARYGAVVVTTRSPEISIEVPTLKRDVSAEQVEVKALPVKVYGERGTVAGQVISAAGEPVVNAQVTVGDHNAITDRQGRYVIRDVPAGAQQVYVRTNDAMGREAVVVEADAVTAIGPVVVTTLTKEDMKRIEQQKVHLRGNVDLSLAQKPLELKKVEGTLDLTKVEAQKAIEVLQAKEAIKVKDEPVIVVDGVQVSPVDKTSIARNMLIRGGQNTGPLLFVDGVLIGAGTDAVNVINKILGPENIESIEVVKGEAARRLYGDRAIEGVIQITTKKR